MNEIQEVYRLQGVNINDKHIEAIVRQMLQKVEILEPGDTALLKGDQLDKIEVDEENAKAEARGGRAALPPRCCSASPRRSLQTRSFISAASFQETTRVLTEASVQRQDRPPGGPEGERIVGRLIPAGTGSYLGPAADRHQARRGAHRPARRTGPDRGAAGRDRRKWRRPRSVEPKQASSRKL